MSCFTYAIDANIKRFQNLLNTSVNAVERLTIQRLLAEEENAKVESQKLALK